jgi:hypothetical protein
LVIRQSMSHHHPALRGVGKVRPTRQFVPNSQFAEEQFPNRT